MDHRYGASVRASQVTTGEPGLISGEVARRILDRHAFDHLTFWVAQDHTDFVDRGVDKGRGLERLLANLRLGPVPIAAMGDAACDVPMLRMAGQAFVPAATLPSYVAARRQALFRCRSGGEDALWSAACQLVPDSALQRQVMSAVAALEYPEWFPTNVTKTLRQGGSVLPRLATVLVGRLTHKETDR